MNFRLSRTSDVIPICLAAVGLTLLLPWFVGAGADSSPEHNDRRERIEQMSADARRHLEANLSAYEQAPPYLREEFKQMSVAIDDDPELAEMLIEYCAWIQSLPAEQQAELRKPNEPADRIRLVTTYLRQIPRPPETPPGGPELQQPNLAVTWMRYVHLVLDYVERQNKLSREELEAVISLLEEPSDRNDSQPLTLWRQGLAVLDELSRRQRPLDQQQRAQLRRLPDRVGRAIWTPAVVQELDDVRNSPAQFQQRLRQIVMATLLDVLIEDLTRDVAPADIRGAFPQHAAMTSGFSDRLSPEQRQKRLALYFRLTRGREGYEDQIKAFGRLTPKSYLGRERLHDDGFPPRPGGPFGPPRRDDGRPLFGGPPEGRGRKPPGPPHDGDRRDPPPRPERQRDPM